MFWLVTESWREIKGLFGLSVDLGSVTCIVAAGRNSKLTVVNLEQPKVKLRHKVLNCFSIFYILIKQPSRQKREKTDLARFHQISRIVSNLESTEFYLDVNTNIALIFCCSGFYRSCN